MWLKLDKEQSVKEKKMYDYIPKIPFTISGYNAIVTLDNSLWGFWTKSSYVSGSINSWDYVQVSMVSYYFF